MQHDADGQDTIEEIIKSSVQENGSDMEIDDVDDDVNLGGNGVCRLCPEWSRIYPEE